MKKSCALFFFSLLVFLLLIPGCRPPGDKVSVIGVWGGSELEVFSQIIKEFEKQYKITINFEATRDINAVLTSRVEAGNPPDIAILPQLSLAVDLAKKKKLVELGSLLDVGKIKQEYSQSWIDLGSVDGKYYGLFFKTALKGLVYYNPKQFARLGLTAPKTWEELGGISDKIIAMGQIPWSIGLESGDASGWPATDWIENIFVRLYGPELYRSWYEGKLAWNSPEIKSAFQLFGEIACNNKMVYGGRDGVVSTSFQDAGNPLFTSPPRAYMFQQASFMAGMIKEGHPELKAMQDYDFFILPPINTAYSTVEIGGDVIVAFRSTPQAKAFLQFLASAEAQAYFAKTGATMPNRNVPLSAYETDIDKSFSKILNSADTIVFDASDMMPSEINAAFWSATLKYVKNPEILDEILAQLEKTRMDVHK